MANPTAIARMANQITNPMVGVQVAAEDANNASIRPVTEFGQAAISDMLWSAF